MSILLSDGDICQVIISPSSDGDDTYILPRTFFMDLAKAQAIHAVQYLEEPCAEHPQFAFDSSGEPVAQGNFSHRYLCPDCMKQIKKELGI